ncbi:PE-PPE domain-containing protein [Mycobacterium sp. TNTM28]|uniref:PE-PPE domain-containing protein n=2 Tax=[Mycobacterium] fortunisiensis TaxID=2600579 RepID=A0ABS6KTW6_9MYCO|nr:PE-PPE domain-containing protein [[Mycobacterium] fortunisiensis]
MTAVLTFGQVADATAAVTAIGVGGWRNPDSTRVNQKFGGDYMPSGSGFVAPDHFIPVPYSASLPIDPSVEDGLPVLRQKVGETSGDIVIVGYSEGSIVAEKYKRELDAQGSPPPGKNISFVFIAAPTVPNGGIYARFPDLRLPGFTSTGAAETSPYDQTFITIEYDPVGDFPAYANPLSLANALAGLIYLHGDPTPDAADLNDPDAIIVTPVDKPGGGQDTYILVRTEHLPLLQPIRDVSAALNITAITEPLLGAIEPTLKLGVDMGYTDRDYSDPATPTRFRLTTPPERIAETIKQLPDAFQQGADNVKNGLPSTATPSTTSGPTQRITAKKDEAKVPQKPAKRTPAQRRDNMRNAVPDLAKKVKNTFKPKPKSKPRHETKPKTESDTDKAA